MHERRKQANQLYYQRTSMENYSQQFEYTEKKTTGTTFPLYKKRTGTAFPCVPVRLEPCLSVCAKCEADSSFVQKLLGGPKISKLGHVTLSHASFEP